jgi:ubiquinone/menaquinone biosynthesis C-methylase UbiE
LLLIGIPELSPVGETERVREIIDRAAPRYDREIGFYERVLFGDGRRWICSRAQGTVLEIGVGTGRNLGFYGDNVQLTAIDLSPRMLEVAQERAKELPRYVDLRRGDAQSLDFASESFDTVLFSLSLCTIPDDRQALREAHRVLRPDGCLILLEHVRSTNFLARAFQRMIEPLTVRFGADHLTRNPLDHLDQLGFKLTELERSKAGIVERLTARKVDSS